MKEVKIYKVTAIVPQVRHNGQIVRSAGSERKRDGSATGILRKTDLVDGCYLSARGLFRIWGFCVVVVYVGARRSIMVL